MSHILIALALCAALVIYPGGASALVALWLVSRPSRSPSRVSGLRQRIQVAHPNGAWLGAGLLCGLVVLPLPWGGSPVAQINVGGLAGPGLGGLALSLLGLWVLESFGRASSRLQGSTLISLGWALGLVVFAVALRAPGWTGVMSGGGLGAELARLGLGLVSIVAIPWAGGSDPRHLLTAAAWAARLALSLSLVLPQLASLPAPVALGIWWSACVLLAAGWAGGLRDLVHQLGRVSTGAAAGRM